MVQFLSMNFFFLGFLQFLLDFSKVPFFYVTLYVSGKICRMLPRCLHEYVLLHQPHFELPRLDIITNGGWGGGRLLTFEAILQDSQ